MSEDEEVQKGEKKVESMIVELKKKKRKRKELRGSSEDKSS